MPYIEPHLRGAIADQVGDTLEAAEGWSAGEFAYALALIFRAYIGPKSFTKMALLFGVVILSLFELYRRVVAPYEERKKEENGDVY